MKKAGKSKKSRMMILVMLVPVILVFWFVTAPAGMAVQRIAAGSGPGPISRLIIDAAGWYQAPMQYLDKIPVLKRISDSLEARWCDLLEAPETTP